MLKRLFSAVFLLTLFSGILFPLSIHAAIPTIVDQPATPAQPAVIVTELGGGLPDFFELYNQSAQPVSLEGWHINFVIRGTDGNGQLIDQAYTVGLPSAWLLSKQYHMVQRGNGNAENMSFYQSATALQNPMLIRAAVTDTTGVEMYNIVPSPALGENQWAQHKQRTNTSLKMSGTFSSDYSLKTTSPTGFSDALYMPPETVALQVLEILPNARDCSPIESSVDCGDYVKLYNPTSSPINTSNYRLRTDSGGLKSSSTNTFNLMGVIDPSEYLVVHAKDSGELISITNTGGYVWLEDTQGVKTYQSTMVSYPDASATAAKGMSWAFDRSNNTWKWMSPAPDGPNYWPVDVNSKGADAPAQTAADCGPGKERNPDTNRCRTIRSTASSTTSPCKAGQERNPATNRCRSVLGASTTLKPCNSDQHRNPETNRCVKSVANQNLAPCKPGQTRNPATNRCRKVNLASKSLPSIKDVESKTNATPTSWWFAVAALSAALAYGIYEWRHDIMQRIRRVSPGLKRYR